MHGGSKRLSSGPAGPQAAPGTTIAAAPGRRAASPGSTRPTEAMLPHLPGGAAVVAFDGSGAMIVRDAPHGHAQTILVIRASGAGDPSFHIRVLHAIGERAPVVVGGNLADRIAFEREYVAVGHHPERLLDDAHLGGLDPLALTRRLAEVRSHPG